jgi:hypothetical protein
MVEATGGIYVGRETELVEGTVSGFGSELAEDAKRLVEYDHHSAKIRISSKSGRLRDGFSMKNSFAIEKNIIFAN